MSTLGNILWIIFGGFISAALYALGGLLCCLTIVGIPFGMQAFRLAGATLAPFGKEVVSEPRTGTLALIFDILWLVTAGWPLALSHLAHAGALAVTVVGIPFALQHLKLIPLCLMPFRHDLR